jgi:hypothetical protein
MLAPDTEHRRSLLERFLRIHGKPRVFLPLRLVQLANEHKVSISLSIGPALYHTVRTGAPV